MDRGVYSSGGGEEPDTTEVSKQHQQEGFPRGLAVKNLPANAGDTGLIPVSGRTPGEGNGNPLQSSSLGNLLDRGTWRASPWDHKESDMTQQQNSNKKIERTEIWRVCHFYIYSSWVFFIFEFGVYLV